MKKRELIKRIKDLINQNFDYMYDHVENEVFYEALSTTYYTKTINQLLILESRLKFQLSEKKDV